MLMTTRFRMGVLASALCFGAITSQASIIAFNSALPLGNLPQSVVISGITVSAFEVSKTNGTSWMNTGILNNRNEAAAEFGLGVCADPHNCPASGNGSINEIDNNGSSFDLIRLDFGSTTFVNNVRLSSLDSGEKDGFAIFGSNMAQPDLSMLIPLAEGTNLSAGSVSPTITLNQSLRYIFVVPGYRGTSNTGSDFLLWSADQAGLAAPEPWTIVLTGVGLVAIGIVRRAKV